MKLNEKTFSSVKVKLFTTLSLTILLIILFLIVVNNFALENFYLYSKQKELKSVYEKINNYYKNYNYENNIETELEKIAVKNNFDILIKDYNGINIYTTNKNFSNVIGTISDMINKFNTETSQDIEKNEKFIIKKQRDVKKIGRAHV